MLSEKPKVSIGIPCYNRPKTLWRTLNSVVNQTYKNIEIIISDNASPDPRVEKICKYFASKDERIKYYRQTNNKGMAFNFNFVVKQASGEYFMWLCDDDSISDNYIERCISIITNQKDIRLVSGRIDTYKTMNILNNSPYIRVLKYFLNYAYIHVMIFSIMPKSDAYFPYSFHGCDWISVANSLFKGKLLIIDDILFRYSINGTSSQSASYARSQGLNRLTDRLPIFSVAFTYMKHIFCRKHPYEDISLFARIFFPILIPIAMLIARFKANMLHIMKLILPQFIVDFLNRIARRKK